MKITVMRDNEVLKICYNFQVWNDENNMYLAALLQHELDNTGLGCVWVQVERNETSVLKI
jgi:hypothetical protein